MVRDAAKRPLLTMRRNAAAKSALGKMREK